MTLTWIARLAGGETPVFDTDDLRNVFRTSTEIEPYGFDLRCISGERRGWEGVLDRLLGLSRELVECKCMVAYWDQFVELTFLDDKSSEYSAIGEMRDSRDRIEVDALDGPTFIFRRHLISRESAERAVEEFFRTARRPNWLEYDYAP